LEILIANAERRLGAVELPGLGSMAQ
jgi:hypothetical protein